MPLPKNLPQPDSRGDEAHMHVQSRASAAPQVMANRYQLGDRLGSGAFGTVYLVTDLRAGGERKVLKEISVIDLQPDETVDAVREARLLAKLEHPSIVKFHDSFMEREMFYIVTEYCEGGDLAHLIHQWKESGRSFEESLILDWFIQLSTALMFIHERRVLHRDLKTRNIFLKNNLIKLGDFGISRILMSTTDLATTFSGTPHYISPEVVKHEGYNSKSDIWSLGVVLYELCTFEHAFPGKNIMSVMYSIIEGEKPRLPVTFDPKLRKLFGSMLERSPDLRPSARAILEEPFIQQRMETFCGRRHSEHESPSQVRKDARAIAKALSPVKKKSLQGTHDGSLTPKQQLAARKKLKADREAEERMRLATENFQDGRKRFKEQQRRKHTKIVPPWVQEHPDVFSDPKFSITMATLSSFADSAELEVMSDDRPHPLQYNMQAWEEERGGEVEGAKYGGQTKKEEGGGGGEEELKREGERREEGGGQDEAVKSHNEGAIIPEDPILAETHYSQFNDFEDFSSSEDEYEAFLECIEEVLDHTHSPVSPPAPPEPHHDDLCPFSPQARDKKIAQLRDQCVQIFGQVEFERVYQYLRVARAQSAWNEDEARVVSGLRPLTKHFTDCFLVDQLVFLEREERRGGGGGEEEA